MASETGGAFFSSVKKGDLPGIVEKISNLVRNQFSLTFSAGLNDGKAHKIVVRVDVDGDGIPDDPQKVEVQSRQIFNASKAR